jgi:hypothetical protein
MNVNLVLQVGKYLGCMRNIELALCDEREYEWMGYKWAYAQRGNAKSHAEAPTASAPVELEEETRPKLEPSGVQYGRTITEILWLGWRCNFAL